MRIPTALVACVVLVALGCNTTPPQPIPAGPTTELVPLGITFSETFADTEGAKRVVICQFQDGRAEKGYIGEGPVTGDQGAVTKYILKNDPTLVFPRVLAANLKTIGLNVSMAETLTDPVGGEPVREILRKYNADYLIAGRVEEISVRARGDERRPVFTTVGLRLDIYNNEGRLRMYYPAHRSDTDYLGEKAGDAAEVGALLDATLHAAVASIIEDPYFVKSLDLDPDKVKEARAAEPKICPPGNPADDSNGDKAKELEEAVKSTPK